MFIRSAVDSYIWKYSSSFLMKLFSLLRLSGSAGEGHRFKENSGKKMKGFSSLAESVEILLSRPVKLGEMEQQSVDDNERRLWQF